MSTQPVSAVPARREGVSDAAAIAGSLADGRAFELVFDRHWATIHSFCVIPRHFRSSERGRRALRRSAPPESVDAVDDTLGRLEAERLGPRLAAAMRTLSAEERDALLLLAWAGLGYEEISRALDIPIGTVRSRIHRARASVQTYLNSEDT